jgi:hypothetical protein
MTVVSSYKYVRDEIDYYYPRIWDDEEDEIVNQSI